MENTMIVGAPLQMDKIEALKAVFEQTDDYSEQLHGVMDLLGLDASTTTCELCIALVAAVAGEDSADVKEIMAFLESPVVTISEEDWSLMGGVFDKLLPAAEEIGKMDELTDE